MLVSPASSDSSVEDQRDASSERQSVSGLCASPTNLNHSSTTTHALFRAAPSPLTRTIGIAALKEQNARFDQLERGRALDREETWTTRQQDLQDAQQQRDADIEHPLAHRVRDLEEADCLRSLDWEEALLHESQLRADVKDARLQSHQ
jgi:hypothetical protein